MSKVHRRLLALGAVGLLVGAAVAGQSETRDDNAYRQLRRFSEVLNRIHSDYVEETSVEDLMDAAIRGMLQSLDPHSQYLDRKQYGDLMVGTQGSFGGLGIVISIRGEVLTVIAPIEGTPASRMGIQGGDQILFIDGEPTEGFTADDAVNRLRGPEGTDVTIKIRREGVPELLEYTITRDIIKLKSVPFKYVSEDGVGYVRLSQFSKTTGSELEAALDSLEGAGIRGLILDLRSNPGGLLEQAVEVSDLFLDDGQMITYTKGRKRAAENSFVDVSDSRLGEVPLVVLVDGHSASASEIVSGAIQDWDRGLVVGQATFGKGSVQSVIPLDEETGLKLTTAKYYTPSGRCIQRDEFNRKDRDEAEGAKGEADSLAPKEVFYTNARRPVYGGGGIAPDIEIEQRKMEELEARIERRGLFFNFAVEYFPYHAIDRDWEVGPEAIDQFRQFLTKREIEYTPEEWDSSETYVRNGIKRELFRKAFGDEAAYEVLAVTDTQLQATFDLFRKARDLDALFALSTEWRLRKERESAVAGTAPADSLDITIRGDVERQ
ncbi:MAG: S41 family peptidase [Candidatus Latescibacterota bacterium]|nr:MAG: S41 family peptidase [Candidatus Latescibacterota bacterium]